jgi:dipeptidyl aminopeptidase/acylaminoacyl peptidase
MAQRRVMPYGSWPSPITIDMAVASQVLFREPRIFGGDIYWTEGRPAEKGRQVIVRWNARDGLVEVTPPPFNARTMIHEYGGGWYTVDPATGTVYYANLPDNRIYRLPPGESPVALTAESDVRFGDLVFDGARKRLVCIREDHSGLVDGAHVPEGGRVPEPRNELVAVDASTGEVQVLASGYDFYSSPVVARDGGRLAWLAWSHPNMPWDATELWAADVDAAGGLADERLVSGGRDESIVQPEWSADGSLVFVSDRSGWWNLYRWTGSGEPVALAPMKAEFAGPQWVFGLRWYGIADDSTIYATAGGDEGEGGVWAIAPSGEPRLLDLPDERVESLQVGSQDGDGSTFLCYIGGSWAEPRSIVLYDVATGEHTVLRTQFELEVDKGFLAKPEAIEFPTTGGEIAHALYYPPTNSDITGPAGELPPLVVEIHGGPTSAATTALQLEINSFTSRGFAVVDVDYRGSTGYGREYMRKLDGMWGVYDVDDCIAAAQFLAARGDVDANRLTIRGGSAGGFTTLAALVFHDVFAGGASHFGVGDLEGLARDTHKFESRYLDRLVAPYPEGLELYRARSPINHADRLSRPLIVLQGVDDHVVPIAQAEQIVDALRRQHIPYAYLPFEGEGHGFRQAANMSRALEAELSFYAQIFGFELADDFEPVKVEFLGD